MPQYEIMRRKQMVFLDPQKNYSDHNSAVMKTSTKFHVNQMNDLYGNSWTPSITHEWMDKWMDNAMPMISSKYIGLGQWDSECHSPFISAFNNKIQCSTVTRSIFSKILTIDTPYLAHEGEVWGVCCGSKIWFTFCHCYHSAICNTMIN